MGVPDPHAVGKDRLVDAAYAAANFPLPVITVDLGTATTFNVVAVSYTHLDVYKRQMSKRPASRPANRLSQSLSTYSGSTPSFSAMARDTSTS